MKIAIAALALVAALSAADKPDFTGTWSLNVALSNYPSPLPTPAKLRKIVEQKENQLHYVIERDLKGDGQVERSELELEIGSASGDDSVTARWEAKTMVVTITTPTGVTQTEHWTLEEGGKRLTDRTLIRRPDGKENNVLRVYDKQ